MNVETIVILIVSLIACFFGYRFNKSLIAICGLIIGFYLAKTFLPMILTDSNLITICSCVIAIFIGFISFRAYEIGIFLTCFFGIYVFCGNLNLAHDIRIIVGVICGLISGFLAVKFVRPIMIITTASSGAFLFTENILKIINYNNNTLNIVISLVIMILGILYQFKNTKSTE
jgi:hypothetical protein